MKTKIIFIAIMAITILACKKEKNIDPEVITNLAISESATTCYAKATVVEKGSYDILDYGFVYSNTDPNVSLQYGVKVSLGNVLPNDAFSSTFAVQNQYLNATYYVRAYITNPKGTVYGSVMSFQLLQLSVTSMSPTSGKAGDNITISGTSFSTKPNENIVKFNNTLAKVVSATTTKLVVTVPTGIQTDYYGSYISVYVGTGSQSINAGNFTLAATISDFQPKNGTFGTSVTLVGDNLYGVTLMCNDITVYSYSSTTSSITFSIPYTINSSQVKIKIVKGNVVTLADGAFTMNPMTLSAISPQKGYPGTSISVTGTNFNTGYGSMSIKIGGVSATSGYSNSSTMVSGQVPNLSNGTYDVEVSDGITTSILPKAFTVVAPKLTGFSPSSGPYGSQITISGENFSSGSNVSIWQDGYVREYASTVSQDSTKIVVTVPYGSIKGKVQLHVSSGTDLSFSDYFTIEPLNTSITDMIPSTATPGTEIVIKGSGFVSGYTYVRFGTVSAPILSITSNEIRVQVPSNAGTGAMKISIVISDVTTVSNSDFTISQ